MGPREPAKADVGLALASQGIDPSRPRQQSGRKE